MAWNPRFRAGVLLAISTALISGISIPFNKRAVGAVGDVVVFTTVKNSIVGVLLLAFLASRLRHLDLSEVSKRSWVGLSIVAVVGGSVPFLLFFKGLSLASAPSAALIHKTLFLWVAILAVPFLGERLGRWAGLGLVTLATGHLLYGWPSGWGWGAGETMILGATLLWAGETILVKRLLPKVPVQLAATARMAGGGTVMWGYLLVSGQAAGLGGFAAADWGWILLTAVLLMGYVGTWYAALERAPATVVASVLTLGAVVTALVDAARGTLPPAIPAIGLVVMVLGAVAVLAATRAGARAVATHG